MSQGLGKLTGLQDKFSFAGVAAAGIGSAAGDFVGARVGGSKLGNYAASSAASAIANAATRSAINGENFGRNLVAAIPDLIAGILQRAVGSTVDGVKTERRDRSENQTTVGEETERSATAQQAKVLTDDGVPTNDVRPQIDRGDIAPTIEGARAARIQALIDSATTSTADDIDGGELDEAAADSATDKIKDYISSAYNKAYGHYPPDTKHAGKRISIESTSVVKNGHKTDTIYIDVEANFYVDDGTLPTGVTAEAWAAASAKAIETDFSLTQKGKNYTVKYVTRVNHTVNGEIKPDRVNFVLVEQGDVRLAWKDNRTGIALHFEKGYVAFISEKARSRTISHEFGHLAGLRHVGKAPFSSRNPIKGLPNDNLLNYNNSRKVDIRQLQSIYRNPLFNSLFR